MVRYSQEMTNLVYFKIEGTDPAITRLRGRRYHRTYGIVLSSSRVIICGCCCSPYLLSSVG